MESALRGDSLANFEHLRENLRALFSRVETAKQVVQAQLDCTTSFAGGNRDGGNGGIVEPLLATRIDNIVQSVSSKKSTWADLREQYPPNQSCLAPLGSTISGKDVLANTEVAELDAIYCQAATMATYGVELLHFALDGAQVDRRRVRQASDIFAILCATLTDSRDPYRDVLTKELGDKGNACRDEQDTADESEVELDSGKVVPIGRTIQQLGPIVRQRRGRVNKPRANERNHLYRHGRRYLEALEQQRQLRDRDTELEFTSITNTSLHVQLPNIHNGREAGESEEDVPLATLLSLLPNPDSTSHVVLPVGLSRPGVIRDGLLRQGFAESAVTEYFNQFAEGTTNGYDSMWKAWAVWCVRNDIDPCRRSEADLDTYIMEKTVVDRWKSQMRTQVNLIWSIVEGRPPPRKRRHLVKRKNN
ncbi:hypothetical protein GGI19_003423 [Coemansia pectinata]|uniref:Uncharacterized protein n=1 Tax=Coemansia pectinata TaxID=1052879 RepID=A0A9W8LAB3_9FUNG|nr:hypothetical protein GGI19_003423 [Coemansia pectinata]